MVSGLLLACSASAQAPDRALGERLAREGAPPQVAACATCHGARGEGSAAFPPLAGTGAAYLQAQLDAFADGSRKSPVMEPMAKALQAPQRSAVSAFYASLPAPRAAPASAPPRSSDVGAWLAERGRWSDGIPACAQCHGPGGAGIGEHFPPIAGLSAAYMQQQIEAWKAGTRPPGPLGLMAAIAKKLSADDVTAIAAHYAGTGAAPTASGAPAAAPAPPAAATPASPAAAAPVPAPAAPTPASAATPARGTP